MLYQWTVLVFTSWEDAPDKPETKYLPLPYMELRYARLARNSLENRPEDGKPLHSHASWNRETALSQYRTFRPRFLNYLVARVGDDGQKSVWFERRPVGRDDMTPYVAVVYCSEHYVSDKDRGQSGSESKSSDHEALLMTAFQAAEKHFKGRLSDDLERHPRAFWTAANCVPASLDVDEQGTVVDVVEGPERVLLESKDVSLSSNPIWLGRLCLTPNSLLDVQHKRHHPSGGACHCPGGKYHPAMGRQRTPCLGSAHLDAS